MLKLYSLNHIKKMLIDKYGTCPEIIQISHDKDFTDIKCKINQENIIVRVSPYYIFFVDKRGYGFAEDNPDVKTIIKWRKLLYKLNGDIYYNQLREFILEDDKRIIKEYNGAIKVLAQKVKEAKNQKSKGKEPDISVERLLALMSYAEKARDSYLTISKHSLVMNETKTVN